MNDVASEHWPTQGSCTQPSIDPTRTRSRSRGSKKVRADAFAPEPRNAQGVLM